MPAKTLRRSRNILSQFDFAYFYCYIITIETLVSFLACLFILVPLLLIIVVLFILLEDIPHPLIYLVSIPVKLMQLRPVLAFIED